MRQDYSKLNQESEITNLECYNPAEVGREKIEFDVLFVGAGPATLAGAYRLHQLLEERKIQASIAVIEKAPELGAHTLSGAVMNPRALRELIPDYLERGAPVEVPVKEDEVYYLTATGAFKFPMTPPPLANHGNYVVALSRVVRWLGEQVQQKGIDIFLGFPGQELLFDGDRVIGVKAGEKGINRKGEQKPNYEAGVDIMAKVVVLGEGCHGSLTKSLVKKLNLREGKNPQSHSTGVKELWEIPASQHREGLVVHTMGYPLDTRTFGGGFIYHAKDRQVSLGWVVGLDYNRYDLDPQEELQKYKAHPLVAKMLAGGKMLQYGAKTIPEGGYFALPRYYGDGFVLVGDSAGFLESQKLKGIHLAMKSGMLCAEAIVEALAAKDYSASKLRRYEVLVEQSWIKPELWKVRNFHQGFQYGFWPGLALAGLGYLTGGWALVNRLPAHADWSEMEKKEGVQAKAPWPRDEKLTFKKLTDVYYSGTKHEEDQPSHLVVLPDDQRDICNNRCTREFGNPCQHFCPAGVYEMVPADDGKDKKFFINFANCVHCKTCDIKDPYQVITWTTPEGGGGPNYYNL